MTKNNTENNKQGHHTPTYARIAIALLAFNFLLTGYCVVKMSKYTQVQLDGGQQVGSVDSIINKAKAATATTTAAEENK